MIKMYPLLLGISFLSVAAQKKSFLGFYKDSVSNTSVEMLTLLFAFASFWGLGFVYNI